MWLKIGAKFKFVIFTDSIEESEREVMAAAELCIGCGGPAVPRYRRHLEQHLKPLWESLAGTVMENIEVNLDLGAILSGGFVCRKCYRLFDSLFKGIKVIYCTCMKTCQTDLISRHWRQT